jgi:hypothetical protein
MRQLDSLGCSTICFAIKRRSSSVRAPESPDRRARQRKSYIEGEIVVSAEVVRIADPARSLSMISWSCGGVMPTVQPLLKVAS